MRQLVDGAGQVTLAQGSRPFGAPLWQVGSGRSGFGYTGEQVDGGTGLVFLRARYYEPLTGRFLSLDPWRGNERRPGTLNRYVYVLNNSINGTDPSGLRCLFFDENCDEIAGEAWDWLTGKADEAVDYVDNKVRGSTGSSGSLLGGLSSMAVNYLAGMILEFADSQSLGLLSNTLIPSWYTDDDPFFVMGRHGGRGVSDALGAIEVAWGSFCGGATIVEAAVPGGQPVAVLTGVGYFVLTAHGGAVLTANRMRPLPPVVFAETGESSSRTADTVEDHTELLDSKSAGDIDNKMCWGRTCYTKAVEEGLDPKYQGQRRVILQLADEAGSEHHAVLGLLDENGGITVIDKTDFGSRFGSDIPLDQYMENVKEFTRFRTQNELNAAFDAGIISRSDLKKYISGWSQGIQVQVWPDLPKIFTEVP